MKRPFSFRNFSIYVHFSFSYPNQRVPFPYMLCRVVGGLLCCCCEREWWGRKGERRHPSQPIKRTNASFFILRVCAHDRLPCLCVGYMGMGLAFRLFEVGCCCCCCWRPSTCLPCCLPKVLTEATARPLLCTIWNEPRPNQHGIIV